MKDKEAQIGSFTSHLTPSDHKKLVKLIGEKCTILCSLDYVSCESLYDSGAMLSLVSSDWLQKRLPSKVIKPVRDLLDDHEIMLTTATYDSIPFSGYVELEFRLSSWKDDRCLLVPVLVTSAKLSEPLIRYNVIHELVENTEEYGMSQEELIGHLEHSIPSVENVKGGVNLIQEKTNADLCEVRTTREHI